jgi:hypothetical protein
MSLFQQLLDNMAGKESIRTSHNNFHSWSISDARCKEIRKSQKEGMKETKMLIHIAAKIFGR